MPDLPTPNRLSDQQREAAGQARLIPGDGAPDWLALLQAAIAVDSRGKAGVAARLGVSRGYVSQITSLGRSARPPSPVFIRKVLSRYHVVACPARGGLPVSYADCLRGNKPCPTSNVLDARLWRECQCCPNRPAMPGAQPEGDPS